MADPGWLFSPIGKNMIKVNAAQLSPTISSPCYQEGVFGIKGLLLGREYYENGNLRFEGFLRIHFAYGPNPPVFGRFCDPEGNELFFGEFSIRSGGVGYPTVIIPETYTSMRVQSHPKYSCLMWEDMDRELIEEMRDNLNRIKKPATSSQLTRMIDEIIQKDDLIIPGIRKST